MRLFQLYQYCLFGVFSAFHSSSGFIYSKRPTAEECHEHRWLLPTEFMIKKRERAVFLGSRLKVCNMIYEIGKL